MNFFYFLFVLIILLAGAAPAKPMPVAELSQKIFEKDLDKRTCKTVSRGINDNVGSYDKDLESLIEKIVANVQGQKKIELMGLFHPRLAVTKNQLDRSFKKMSNTLGKISSVSVYRLWAINTVDGTPSLIQCPEDALALGPHYGYDLQFGLWLQVMGENELGRIYTTIIASQNKWKLGSWHLQQWTHKGKDPQAWVEEALGDAAKERKFSAYVKMQVAEKLLDGGAYVFPQLKADAEVTKNSYFTQQGFIEYLRSLRTSPDAEIVSAESIFAKDGAGLGVRFIVSEKLKNPSLVELCNSAAQAIYAKAQDLTLGGLRCAYLLKGEDTDRDGKLGSRFVPRTEIKLVKPQ